MFGLPNAPMTDEAGNELVQKCLECDAIGEIVTLRAGDESFRKCEACETLEGRTEWVAENE